MLIPIILLLGLLTLGLLGLGVWFLLAERAKPNKSHHQFISSDQPEFSTAAYSTTADSSDRPSADHPLTWSGTGCILFFGLVWSGFTLFFVFFMVQAFITDWHEYTLLRDTGQVVDGVITDRRIDYGSADDDDDYYVTYKYTAPLPQGDSQSFTDEVSVNRRTYDDLPPERIVKVLYASSNPSVSDLEQEFGSPAWMFVFFSCFMSVFVVVGVGMLTWGVTRTRKVLLLNARGQVTQGRVTDRWVDTDSDGDNTYCVAYRFDVPLSDSGPILKGEQNAKAYNSLHVGEPVQVRYLPSNPKICRLEL